MKLKVLLLFFTLCFMNNSYAQIQNTEVLFYVHKNDSPNDPNIYVEVLRWKNGTIQTIGRQKMTEVYKNIKKDNYYENLEWEAYYNTDDWYNCYNRELSNSKWDVYERHLKRWAFGGREISPEHSDFRAFKKDLSEYMYWLEPDYCNQGRLIYKRLTKSEIKKASTHRDFLD